MEKLLKQLYLSSEEFQKVKHLKNFDPEDYQWQQDCQLWKKVQFSTFSDEMWKDFPIYK